MSVFDIVTTQQRDPWGGTGNLPGLNRSIGNLNQPWASYEDEWKAMLTQEELAGLGELYDYSAPGGGSRDLIANYQNLGQQLQGGFDQVQDFYSGAVDWDPITSEGPDMATVAMMADNPYMNGMIDAASRDISRNLYEDQLPGIAAYSAGTGNMGSSRRGAAEAIAERGAADRIGDISSSMRGSAYERALGLEANRSINNANLARGNRQDTMSAADRLAGLGEYGVNLQGLADDRLRQATSDMASVGQYYREQPTQQIERMYNMTVPQEIAFGELTTTQEIPEELAWLRTIAGLPTGDGGTVGGDLGDWIGDLIGNIPGLGDVFGNDPSATTETAEPGSVDDVINDAANNPFPEIDFGTIDTTAGTQATPGANDPSSPSLPAVTPPAVAPPLVNPAVDSPSNVYGSPNYGTPIPELRIGGEGTPQGDILTRGAPVSTAPGVQPEPGMAAPGVMPGQTAPIMGGGRPTFRPEWEPTVASGDTGPSAPTGSAGAAAPTTAAGGGGVEQDTRESFWGTDYPDDPSSQRGVEYAGAAWNRARDTMSNEAAKGLADTLVTIFNGIFNASITQGKSPAEAEQAASKAGRKMEILLNPDAPMSAEEAREMAEMDISGGINVTGTAPPFDPTQFSPFGGSGGMTYGNPMGGSFDFGTYPGPDVGPGSGIM